MLLKKNALSLLAGLALCACLGRSAACAAGSGAARQSVLSRRASQPITQTNEFNGRIEAVDRVNIVARVTAFLEKRLFDGWRRGQEGRPSLSAREGPVPGRCRREASAGRAARGDARQCAPDHRARPHSAWRSGRLAIELRRGRCQSAQPRGAGPGRASPAAILADQSWLYRHSFADRRQNRPNADHNRQRGQPQFGCADDHRQPGSRCM